VTRRYRWKPGLSGERPSGVELGTCYRIKNTTDERGTKGSEYDLIDGTGTVVARYVPRSCLEECV
jgi:hypothetical protein